MSRWMTRLVCAWANRRDHIQNQPDPGLHAEIVGFAVAVDGLAVYVFQHEVLTSIERPRIEQSRNVRVR